MITMTMIEALRDAEYALGRYDGQMEAGMRVIPEHRMTAQKRRDQIVEKIWATFTEERDPMSPDYAALSQHELTSSIEDSRDAAGLGAGLMALSDEERFNIEYASHV
jgi:hypothetical protein